jgi:Ribonuclease G/E
MIRATSADRTDDLRDLIEDLRRMERRRLEATPGSSEYMEVLGFERRLAERIHDEVVRLDNERGLRADRTRAAS